MLLTTLKSWPVLNEKLGRHVFGNLTSFTYNYEGRRNLRALRRNVAKPTAPVAAFLRNMAKEGFYQLPDVLPAALMEQVNEAYLGALADPERSIDVMSLRAQQDGLDVYCRSVDAEKVTEFDLLITPEINNLIHAYFGGPPAVQLGCARRNQHIPAHIASEYDIYSNTWHCDNESSDRIKMFVALNDITSDCGPLHFLSRPRTRQIIKKGFKHRDDYGIELNEIEDPRYLNKFVGVKGSVMFINVTQCMHRAGIPAPGFYRDIVEIQFRTAAVP